MSDQPHRIQLRRTKGWRMPANTVSVTRPGPLGNPWSIAKAREIGFLSPDAELARICVRIFANAMDEHLPAVEAHISRLPGLRGKNLACWCALDQPCHADVLLELANAPLACEAPDA